MRALKPQDWPGGLVPPMARKLAALEDRDAVLLAVRQVKTPWVRDAFDEAGPGAITVEGPKPIKGPRKSGRPIVPALIVRVVRPQLGPRRPERAAALVVWVNEKGLLSVCEKAGPARVVARK